MYLLHSISLPYIMLTYMYIFSCQIKNEKKKSHDKNMAALYVCYGNSKIKFHNLRSIKCALYEIESIIKSLINSHLDLNPLKRRSICMQVTSSERFKKKFYCSVYKLFLRKNGLEVTNDVPSAFS